ncbi:uncharacterized protein LOC132394741 [Hypanus sabinus]|uniref:uncharacterized protein LOC132394741 n=1 Tax=Hypanus sabinus TaxID=79690 RepID=UPI0028C50DAD|nr:uncharacterized protein LOC132394741 [Hypanus sabinus]
MERDNVRQWEYITPTSKYDGSSEADQVKVTSSRKSPLVNEVQMRSYSSSMLSESSILTDVRINAMDHAMRFVRPVGSNVVLPGFKPVNLESIQWRFLNYKTKKTVIQYSHFKFMMNPFYRHRAEFNVTSGALLLRDLQLKDSGIYEVILNPKANKTLMKGDEISSIHLDVQGFSIAYRAGSGIGCILCLATVTYVMVLFLHHHSQDSLSFLSNYWKRNIFLGSETIAVLIACLPLIKSKQNLKKCRLAYQALSLKIILMVMLYVCGLGLFTLFHAKFSFKLRRNYVKLKEVKRYRQSRNEES